MRQLQGPNGARRTLHGADPPHDPAAEGRARPSQEEFQHVESRRREQLFEEQSPLEGRGKQKPAIFFSLFYFFNPPFSLLLSLYLKPLAQSLLICFQFFFFSFFRPQK